MRVMMSVTLLCASLCASWAIGCGGGSATANGSGGAIAPGAGGSQASGSGGTPGTGGTQASGTGGAPGVGGGGSQTGGSGGAGVAGRDGAADRDDDAPRSGGMCPEPAPAPCGGDLAGTWKIRVDECVLPTSYAYCPGLTSAVASSSTYGATYAFGADGTLSVSAGGRFIATQFYPPECYSGDAGAIRSCTDLGNELQRAGERAVDAGASGILSSIYKCSADPNRICVCDQDVTYGPRLMTGTYTTSGTKLSIVGLSDASIPDAGGLEESRVGWGNYCVSGNTLTTWPADPSSNTRLTVLTR